MVRLAERVRNRLAGLFPDERVSISITPSIGVAAFPQDASNAEDLIRLADMAMYKAKDSGKNQVIDRLIAPLQRRLPASLAMPESTCGFPLHLPDPVRPPSPVPSKLRCPNLPMNIA